ncbi:MAG: hypothetical protein RJB08_1232 [Actinomycetota bacterium]|jgi:predicted HAD superfamily phosphohydrolase
MILVDECHWWYRERRWCHMVSDTSYEELHEIASAMGIPRRGFQGDHYDVPEDYRDDAIRLGAVPVGSRELLARLKAAGLRISPARRRASGTTPPPDLRTGHQP